eukprot:m51a1_g9006 hypothetical protein (237) ;mRNA; r:123303-133408
MRFWTTQEHVDGPPAIVLSFEDIACSDREKLMCITVSAKWRQKRSLTIADIHTDESRLVLMANVGGTVLMSPPFSVSSRNRRCHNRAVCALPYDRPSFLEFVRISRDVPSLDSLMFRSVPSPLRLPLIVERFYIDYILRNCKGAINFPLLQQYRQATTPAARQDYDDAVVQASIITISILTRNRVILTKEEAVQARTDCLEVLYFTTPFWDPTENTTHYKKDGFELLAVEGQEYEQ